MEPTTPENVDNIVLDKTPEADIYKLINDDLSFYCIYEIF